MRYLAICWIAFALQESDLSPSQIIGRYEANLTRIYSLEAHISGRRSTDEGASWTKMYEFAVRRSGQRESVDQILFGALVGDTWRESPSRNQVVYSADETRMLSTVGVEGIPRGPLEGQDRLETTGAISAPTMTGPHGRNVNWCQFLLLVPDVRYSLRQLLEQSPSPSARRIQTEDDRDAWELSLAAPDGGYSYRVTILPDRGYLIGKVRSQFRDANRPGSPPQVSTSEVLDFAEPEPGIWFPMRVRTTYEDQPNLILDVEAKDVVINQPVDADQLDLDFPQGAIVVDNTQQTYHLWGRGEPEHTFGSAEEFSAWLRREQALALSEPRGVPWWPIISLLVALAAVAVLWWLRGRLRGVPQAL